MRKLLCTLALAAIVAPSVSHAQVQIDMGRITCEEYLALPPDLSRDFAAWMSGWFNQKNNYTFIDLDAYQRNVDNVRKWCASNPKESVMSGLQRATIKN